MACFEELDGYVDLEFASADPRASSPVDCLT